jgi:nucleoside-diphosphate-sugar epimerase
VLADEKILVTGVSGMVGAPIASYLARDNEVWGVARFADATDRTDALYTNPLSRHAIEAHGVTTRALDLGSPDFSDLPDDFTYVLHLAHTRLGDQIDRAVQVNAIGAGRVLQHCRRAKAALVMSSHAVYSPPPDVFHPAAEGDDVGRAVTPWAPSSPASKISLEAVARFCAEAFDLRVIVTRLNTVYGIHGGVAVGLPLLNMDAVMADEPVDAIADPNPHSPIALDDMYAQLEALLDAASVPGATVNWTGEETVTLQQWCAQVGALGHKEPRINVTPVPGTLEGSVGDATRLRGIVGPSGRTFASRYAEMFAARYGAPVRPSR